MFHSRILLCSAFASALSLASLQTVRAVEASPEQAAKPAATKAAEPEKATSAATVETPSTPAPAQAPAAEDKKATEELEMKLSTALRSYSLLQKEFDNYKANAEKAASAATARQAALQGEVDGLKQQLDGAKTESADKTTTTTALQEELRTVRAYAVNQGMELNTLRDQNRQLLANNARLIEENVQYRTRLALKTDNIAGGHPAPMRPGTTAAQQAIVLPAQLKNAPKPAKVEEKETSKAEAEQQHVIAEGDSLSKISKRYYGTPNRWPEIFEANRNILSDPSRLPAGASLRIP